MVILEMLSGGHPWTKVKRRMLDNVHVIMALEIPQLSDDIRDSPELNVLLKRIFVPAKDRSYSWDIIKDPWLVVMAMGARKHVAH